MISCFIGVLQLLIFQFGKDFLAKIKSSLGLDVISTSGLPEDAAKRLRRRQIRGAIEQMRVFVLGNTLFAPVLAMQAWGLGINALVISWTAVMLAFSWWLFWRWLTSYQTDGSRADMDRFVNETKINASLWCSGMVLFFPHVSGYELTLLLTVMIGSLALGTVGFSQAPHAAFWYLGIHAVVLTGVPGIKALATESSQDLLLAFLALVACGAIFNSVLERAKAQMQAFLDHEALAQKTEVVDLLLKDYEHQATEWMWQTRASGALIRCPSQVMELFKLPSATSEPLLLDILRNSVEPKGQEHLEQVSIAFAQENDLNDVTLPFQDPKDGVTCWIAMKGRAQYDKGVFNGYRGIFADATAVVEAKRHVEFMARHDPLTGLYNRNHIQSELERLDAKQQFALAFLIDLDGFKQVNDSYGHVTGDKLLEIVAKRLQELLGTQACIGRLGGDEFIVLYPTNDPGEMHRIRFEVAQELLESIAKPYRIEHLEVSVSGSIGMASFPNDTKHGTTLLRYADLALYAAKRQGKNRSVSFTRSLLDGVQNRLHVTDRLRKAIENNSVVPHYQPQFCAKTGRLIGAEALARWTDEELGFVGPDVFIAIAEETGLIHELSEQLLRQACCDALRWDVNESGEPLMLAVNLSPVEVTIGNVAKKILKVLSETNFPSSRLEIEVTESVLIDDVSTTRFFLEELSDAGVKIALDDFGTGYSSLSYIRALPLDKLKIDRSFIFEVEEEESQSIVSTIIGMCDRLGLEVVAEGVENQKSADILRDLGCDLLQGYYFSKPLAANDFVQFATTIPKQATA